jgi:hypothetical protein
MNNLRTSSDQISSQFNSLEEFPIDLWIEVMASLEPRDVLSLSTVRDCLPFIVVILVIFQRHAACCILC